MTRVFLLELSFDQDVALVNAAFAILTFFAGIAALYIANKQLAPLRRDIEQIARVRRQERQVNALKAPRSVRTLVGFDPRFTNLEWGRLTAQLAGRRDTLSIGLSRDYDEFYRDFEAHIAAKDHFAKSVLLIDLVYVPSLLERGLIAELRDGGDLDFDALLEKRARSRGTRPDVRTTAVMRLLCSDQQGRVGALPAWVN